MAGYNLIILGYIVVFHFIFLFMTKRLCWQVRGRLFIGIISQLRVGKKSQVKIANDNVKNPIPYLYSQSI